MVEQSSGSKSVCWGAASCKDSLAATAALGSLVPVSEAEVRAVIGEVTAADIVVSDCSCSEAEVEVAIEADIECFAKEATGVVIVVVEAAMDIGSAVGTNSAIAVECSCSVGVIGVGAAVGVAENFAEGVVEEAVAGKGIAVEIARCGSCSAVAIAAVIAVVAAAAGAVGAKPRSSLAWAGTVAARRGLAAVVASCPAPETDSIARSPTGSDRVQVETVTALQVAVAIGNCCCVALRSHCG